MSTQAPIRRITAPQITARKGGEPIVSLTSITPILRRLLIAMLILSLWGIVWEWSCTGWNQLFLFHWI